jgi:hypothetical protein
VISDDLHAYAELKAMNSGRSAEVVRMKFLNWLRTIKPGDALKWGAVVFAYCLAILFLVSVTIAIVEQYS